MKEVRSKSTLRITNIIYYFNILYGYYTYFVLYICWDCRVEIDIRDPKRVRTDTCSRKFRKVLEICQRRSTSMISNDTESQSEHSISQYY